MEIAGYDFVNVGEGKIFFNFMTEVFSNVKENMFWKRMVDESSSKHRKNQHVLVYPINSITMFTAMSEHPILLLAGEYDTNNCTFLTLKLSFLCYSAPSENVFKRVEF